MQFMPLWLPGQPQITTCDHHAIYDCQDLVEIVHALLILDLHDDCDAGAVWSQHLPDVVDVLCMVDE